jgi:uncharacterized membrane protein YfcA
MDGGAPMTAAVWLIALGSVVAGFVQGLSGFAFSLVAMSFWAWAVEPRLAAALAIFGGLSGQIVAAVSVRRGFDLKLLLPFLVGGLAGVPIGISLLPLLDVQLFKLLVGSLLIVWSSLMLFARRLPRIADRGPLADGAVGLLGGICGGIAGFTGAIPTLWCTVRGMEKTAQRSIIQNFNLVMLAVTMSAYIAAGTVTRDMLPMFAVVLSTMLLPVLLGARVYIGISEAAFRTIVLTLLVASGAALLVSALPVRLHSSSGVPPPVFATSSCLTRSTLNFCALAMIRSSASSKSNDVALEKRV